MCIVDDVSKQHGIVDKSIFAGCSLGNKEAVFEIKKNIFS